MSETIPVVVVAEDANHVPNIRLEYARVMRRCTPKQRVWLRRVYANCGQPWSEKVMRDPKNDTLLSKSTIWKWMRNDNVQRALQLQDKMSQLDSGITHARQMREFERIAFESVKDFRAPDGKRLPFKDWTDDMCAAVSEMEFDDQGNVIRVKLHRKDPAQDTLARITGLLVDRTELSVAKTNAPVVNIVRDAGG